MNSLLLVRWNTLITLKNFKDTLHKGLKCYITKNQSSLMIKKPITRFDLG